MSNKDTINGEEKNSVFTPENIQAALSALPHNYLKQTYDLLVAQAAAGTIKKSYSRNWILKVKKGEEFNEDVLRALVEVGLKAKESPFAFLKKRTPATT